MMVLSHNPEPLNASVRFFTASSITETIPKNRQYFQLSPRMQIAGFFSLRLPPTPPSKWAQICSAYLRMFFCLGFLCAYICLCGIVELEAENAPIVAESTGTEAAKKYIKSIQVKSIFNLYM